MKKFLRLTWPNGRNSGQDEMALGYRSKYTYKKLPVNEALELTNLVLEVGKLYEEFRNEDLHQLLYEWRENGRRN